MVVLTRSRPDGEILSLPYLGTTIAAEKKSARFAMFFRRLTHGAGEYLQEEKPDTPIILSRFIELCTKGGPQ